MLLCFGKISGPLGRGAASVARRLEPPASWRRGYTPAPDARACDSRLFGVEEATDGPRGRATCWSASTSLPRVNATTPWRWHARGTVLLHRGGHERSVAGLLYPVSPVARGLCSGKTREGRKEAGEPGHGEPVPGHGLFKFKELYENPWTVPNFLCMSRILLAPFLGHLIIQQHFHLSLALFTLAGATDVLDGYIARTWPNQKSALGSALDPLADKILISFLYVSLTYADLIPALLTALVISRDVGLIAAVFWVRYKTVPAPVTLSKFFNPCYTTAQLKPTLFSKVNTAIQLLLVASSLAAPVFQYTDSVALQCLWYVTAVTTAASGYSYWHYGRKTVQVLNTKSP